MFGNKSRTNIDFSRKLSRFVSDLFPNVSRKCSGFVAEMFRNISDFFRKKSGCFREFPDFFWKRLTVTKTLLCLLASGRCVWCFLPSNSKSTQNCIPGARLWCLESRTQVTKWRNSSYLFNGRMATAKEQTITWMRKECNHTLITVMTTRYGNDRKGV